ncbi:MAG: alpha/beta fold hydrolase [Phycisphaerales bacterium]|jgi:pimeloyl-ACP methyl ester carboxylesterase|nr:alpha/beta fold hydrolase [Phycisphaerales bacterium]
MLHWLRNRSRRFWIGVYAALLVASFVVRSLVPESAYRVPSKSPEVLHVAEVRADGSATGRTIDLAYIDWPATDTKTEGNAIEDRPPVLLLHGSPGDAANWARLGPLLADAGYRVIAPDLPGFGLSSHWIKDYSSRAHARYALSLMDDLGIERAHVVGWSNGGAVALNIADLAPDRLATLTMLAAVGGQAEEGSGSYAFEHFKYAVGYAALVVGGEAVPHFGLLGPLHFRNAFLRNFFDTDQRPLEGVMRSLHVPTLVLHGRHDFLIADWAAERHYAMIPTARLVMLNAMHFIPFQQEEEAAGVLLPFFARHDTPGVPALGGVDDRAPRKVREGFPGWLERRLTDLTDVPWYAEVFVIALLAWRLPYAAPALAGVAGAAMRLDLGVACLGVLIGCLARNRNWQRPSRVGLALAHALIITSIAGPIAKAIIWPATYTLGFMGFALTMILTCWALRVVAHLWTWRRRQELKAYFRRISHHEFWPSWLFYIPLVPWIAWLGARYRGLRSFTCANPGIEHGGGIIGESKAAIIGGLRRGHAPDDVRVLPVAHVPGGASVDERVAILRRELDARPELGGYPIILKPDAGQRGFAMKLARSEQDAREYFRTMTRDAVAQRYHPGPHEIGLAWVRDVDGPEGRAGRIFSVTRKEFPHVTGDGRSTLEELIFRDERLRCQASVFLARFAGRTRRVPRAGERIRLAEAGNHAQGTLFRDGADLITPELERAVDDIAGAFRGHGGGEIDFGRFDIRFESEELLREGRAFGIIELNGVTGESTNIYDPEKSPLWAYGVLLRQWRELYRVGAWRRARGVAPLQRRDMFRTIRAFYKDRPGSSVSD